MYTYKAKPEDFFLTLAFSFYSAYEEKQHSKRKEIASRSWFTSTPAPPGGAAGSLLHKLGLQGKEAAVAKALGSSHSPLICKRTAGTGIKTKQCTTITRRKSHSEVRSCNEERLKVTKTEEPSCAVSTVVERIGSGSNEVRVINDEEMDKRMKSSGDFGKEVEKDKCPGGLASLVADYSDSDSDPGQ